MKDIILTQKNIVELQKIKLNLKSNQAKIALKSFYNLLFQNIFLDDEREVEDVTWLTPPLKDGNDEFQAFSIVRNATDFFSLTKLFTSFNFFPKKISFDHDLGLEDNCFKIFFDTSSEIHSLKELGIDDASISLNKEIQKNLWLESNPENLELKEFYLKYGKKLETTETYCKVEMTGKSCLEFFIDCLLDKINEGVLHPIDLDNISLTFHTMNLVEREKMIGLWNNFKEFVHKEQVLHDYYNGNAHIVIYKDGTRTTEFDENEGLKLDYPLNVDIRLMTKCDFGYNPTTGKSVCSFCHESARTDGKECDYNVLLDTLKDLPKGVEIAIGINDLTDGLESFLKSCLENCWIVNGTINQGALAKKSNQERLKGWIEQDLLKGVGISYRPRMPKMPKWLLDYSNTVVHVINGIDDFNEVKQLHLQGVKKILVLGEKDFGFNKGNVKLDSPSHIEWEKHILELTKYYQVVNFDNLALEQLKIKEKISEDFWQELYQGEHSFYINAVDQYFAPSSRSAILNVSFEDMSIKDYFYMIENQTEIINVRDVS